jgi:hypothetical protein
VCKPKIFIDWINQLIPVLFLLFFESISFFEQEFKLIDKAELAPLIDLIESIVSVS